MVRMDFREIGRLVSDDQITLEYLWNKGSSLSDVGRIDELYTFLEVVRPHSSPCDAHRRPQRTPRRRFSD